MISLYFNILAYSSKDQAVDGVHLPNWILLRNTRRNLVVLCVFDKSFCIWDECRSTSLKVIYQILGIKTLATAMCLYFDFKVWGIRYQCSDHWYAVLLQHFPKCVLTNDHLLALVKFPLPLSINPFRNKHYYLMFLQQHF